MNKAVILLGSNIGDRAKMLQDAIVLISENLIVIENSSGIYETAPWGLENQPSFLNQIIIVKTMLAAPSLLNQLLKIELQLGRVRNEKWEQRCIDLDILFYNDEIINCEGLKIPHPHLHERRFTLIPLNEILPAYIHPQLKKSIADLLNECSDKKNVLRL